MKSIAKKLIPPVIISLARLVGPANKYGFYGNYKSWEEAKKNSAGYDNQEILEQVKNATLKVINNEAAFERDSRTFQTVHYSWPILASLLWIAAKNHGRLNLIDFGGSLGSSFYQNIKFINDIDVSWNVVEQKPFVACGNVINKDPRLRFYDSVKTCVALHNPDIILFSSVLQYIADPFAIIQEVIACKFKHILFDRTCFVRSGNERITIQKVQPSLYNASYPCRFFKEQDFLSWFSSDYDLIEQFVALAGNITINNKIDGIDKGFILKRKE